MALVQDNDIRLTTKNCVCTTSKSINQIQTCTDAVMKRGGGETVVFSPKRRKDLGIWPYEIRIYRHSSSLRALTAGQFRLTRLSTVVGKVCL